MTAWGVALQVVQVVLVAVSVAYVAIQVRGQRKAINFQVYSQVSAAYVRQGASTTDHPILNSVWLPWEPQDRRDQLLAAQDRAREAGLEWGAWREMTEDERKCYRFTREVLEILEQAWQLRKLGLIDEQTYAKWREATAMWKTSRYFPFVLEDTKPRLMRDFCEELDCSDTRSTGKR